MLIEERLNKIVEIIRINDSARIEELAETLEVSRDTVRRDLIRLENEGVIKRTHGGRRLCFMMRGKIRSWKVKKQWADVRQS